MTIDTKALRELQLRRIQIGGNLDRDGEVELYVGTEQESDWLSRDEARQVIDHLSALFGFDAADRLAALEAENARLRSAWGELSGAVLETQDRLDRHGPDWTNVEGEFVWVSVIEEYADIVGQHQEALAAGGEQ